MDDDVNDETYPVSWLPKLIVEDSCPPQLNRTVVIAITAVTLRLIYFFMINLRYVQFSSIFFFFVIKIPRLNPIGNSMRALCHPGSQWF